MTRYDPNALPMPYREISGSVRARAITVGSGEIRLLDERVPVSREDAGTEHCIWFYRVENGTVVGYVSNPNFQLFSDQGVNCMLESSQIERMSVAERLQAMMEQLWDALYRDAGKIVSPEWHRDVSADRKERAERGEAKFLSLEQLRSRLRGTKP